MLTLTLIEGDRCPVIESGAGLHRSWVSLCGQWQTRLVDIRDGPRRRPPAAAPVVARSGAAQGVLMRDRGAGPAATTKVLKAAAWRRGGSLRTSSSASSVSL